MSKGSPRITVRIPAGLLAEMDAEIARAPDCTRLDIDGHSQFIVNAIREFVRKRRAAAHAASLPGWIPPNRPTGLKDVRSVRRSLTDSFRAS